MTIRLLALLLLAATTLAAAAPPHASALAVPALVDWKGLACATLVALYVARRRSRWLSD